MWALAKGALKVVQVGIMFWALADVHGLHDRWLDTVPESATVLTVQMEGFTGPVHVLIPTNCTRFEENDAIIKQRAAHGEQEHAERRLESPGSAAEVTQARSPFTVAFEQSSHLRAGSIGSTGPSQSFGISDGRFLQEERADEGDGIFFNESHIFVERCGKKLTFTMPTAWQRYLAMVYLSGKDTMQELRHTRGRMLWFLTFTTILETLVSTAMVFVSTIPGSPGYQQVQEQASMAMPQKICLAAFNTCFVEIPKKLATTQNTLAILSLFTTFWHEDYYVTSFIPGKCFLAIAGVYVALPCFLLAADAKNGNPVAMLIACSAVLYLVFVFFGVLIPDIFGYSGYNSDFLWNTAMADEVTKMTHGVFQFHGTAEYLKNETIINAKWTEDQRKKDVGQGVVHHANSLSGGKMDVGADVVNWLFGAHASEIIMNFFLDFLLG